MSINVLEIINPQKRNLWEEAIKSLKAHEDHPRIINRKRIIVIKASKIIEELYKDKTFQEIKETVVGKKTPITPSILDLVLMFSPKGPDFYDYMNREGYLDFHYNASKVKDMIDINRLLDEGFTFDEAVLKVTNAREIKIKNGNQTIEGTIILDKENDTFIGLSKDKKSRIFGDYFTDIYYLYVVNGNKCSDRLSFDLEDNTNEEYIKPLIGISRSLVEEIKEKNNCIQITDLSNNVKKIVCTNATSREFSVATKPIRKEPNPNLIAPISRFGNRTDICYRNIDSSATKNIHNHKFDEENCLIDNQTIYYVALDNRYYTIKVEKDGMYICQLTYHEETHPFPLDDFIEYISFYDSDIIDENMKRYHIRENKIIQSDINGLRLSSQEHSIGGSSGSIFHFAGKDFSSLSEYTTNEKLEVGALLIITKRIRDELKNVKEIESCDELIRRLDDILQKGNEFGLLTEAETISALMDKGLTINESLEEVTDVREITIKDNKETITGTIILENNGSFIGIKSDEKTPMSGNITEDKKIIVSINNQETIYNGDLNRKGTNGYVEGCHCFASINLSPILDSDNSKKDNIRKLFDQNKNLKKN